MTSTDMTIFKKNPALKLLQGYEDDLTGMLGGTGGGGFGRRISIRGGRFREVLNGKDVRVSRDVSLDVVIVAAAPLARHFYEGEYVEGEGTAPTCWSSDTVTPSADVPKGQRQADRCKDCPQDIKGSGKRDDSRACRFSQRLAILLEGSIVDGSIYQMQLPATSLFGDDKNKMPLQAYGRLLRANDTHVISVVTRMTMDEDVTQPKLFFSPVRPLTEEELVAVLAHRDSEDAHAAVELTVAQTDKAPPPKRADVIASTATDEDDDEAEAAPAPAPATTRKPRQTKAEKEAAAPAPAAAKTNGKKGGWADVDEPDVRKTEKPAPEPVSASKLSSVLSEWDDA